MTCPACGSVHSADGGALFERSANLRDLEAAKPKLKKLATVVAALEKKLEQAAVKPAPAAAPIAPKVEKEKRGKHGKYF